MFDRHMRSLIDPPLNWVAKGLAKTPLTANQLTLLGMVLGLVAAWRVYELDFGVALLFIALSRLADGLDGPLARARCENSDFGGYLDILCDFVFYAAIPLAFAASIPTYALPAACLLASFLLTGVSHLAFAIHAEKRGLETQAQGQKSFYFADGLAEGTETIAAFVFMCLMPQIFPLLAYGYAALCVASAIGRTISARKAFQAEHPSN
ncbi:MAG: CDP-alcohol phosphatidyltransferase family protein [Pseudomonadota bacterium]